MLQNSLTEDWAQYGLRKHLCDLAREHRRLDAGEALCKVAELLKTVFPRRDADEKIQCQRVARAFCAAGLTPKQAAVVEASIRQLSDSDLVAVLNECIGDQGSSQKARYTEIRVRQIRFRALKKLRAKEGLESVDWLMRFSSLSDIRRGRPEKQSRRILRAE